MPVSQTIDHYLAGIDDVGDELYWNMHRFARQIGADDKPHFEFGRVDLLVAFDVERRRRQPRLVGNDRRSDLSGNVIHADLVDGATGQIGNAKVEDRLADVGSTGHVDARFQGDGIEQRV